MDKKAIVEAISNPALVCRAITAIRSDPGPLELAYNASENVYGRDMSYYIYRRGLNYVIAAECGNIVPMEAVVLGLDRATRAIAQGGNLPAGVTVSCLAIVSNSRISTYCASDYTMTREEIRPDGSRVGKKTLDTGGWFSIVLGSDAMDMEEVINDMEARLNED